MEINRYSGNTTPYNQTSQNKESKNTTENSKASEPKKVTKAEALRIFKKDLRKELSVIYGKSSSSVLSHSVHITDEALEKMQSNPEFKDEMFETLRKKVKSSHKLTNNVNVTTRIGIDGYSSHSTTVYKTNSKNMVEDKRAIADRKARGALFYMTENKKDVSSKNKIDSGKSLLDMRREQQIYDMGVRERNVIAQSHKRTSFMRGFAPK